MAVAKSKNPKKQITGIIKLQIKAGKATPAPPIGPALGQHGVNIMEFCKAYNDATKDRGDTVIPVEIYVHADRTFTFKLKTPPASVLILQAAKISKGSPVPNLNIVGSLTQQQVEEIAKMKMEDLNTTSLESAIKTISGSARSMGVKVK